jgi:hypothetical protein
MGAAPYSAKIDVTRGPLPACSGFDDPFLLYCQGSVATQGRIGPLRRACYAYVCRLLVAPVFPTQVLRNCLWQFTQLMVI